MKGAYMFKRITNSYISSVLERSGLKQEDIVITDPKTEILSGMAKMAKDEIRSVIETADLSQIIIIDPESL